MVCDNCGEVYELADNTFIKTNLSNLGYRTEYNLCPKCAEVLITLIRYRLLRRAYLIVNKYLISTNG